jgi:hypothetical protein
MKSEALQRTVFVLGAALAVSFSLTPFLLFLSLAFKTQTQVTAIPPQLDIW